MADAETESKCDGADSKFLEYSGPKPGVKYPLTVIYCPPDSKYADCTRDEVIVPTVK